MEEQFSILTDNINVVSDSNTSINWVYMGIGLTVASLIYFVLKYFVFRKNKSVSFDSDNEEFAQDMSQSQCQVRNTNETDNQNTRGVDEPKNVNFCDGDKCLI